MSVSSYIEGWKVALDLVSSPVNSYQTIRGSGINAPGAILMIVGVDIIVIGRALLGRPFQ